jgi:lactate dehydrogenase-like 2-hydroxyacid dehydrogenase
MKPVKIVFLDAATLGNVDNLSYLAGMGYYTEYDFTSSVERLKHIADNTVIITNKVLIDKYIMDKCPDIKLICIAATGMNNVDLEYAKQKGIEVKNVSGYSTESVAQSTFSMLFHLLHGNAYYDEYVKSGQYSKSQIFTNHGKPFWELKNKQFGIIGLGTIGKRVARIADVFGCRVVYFSTSGKNLNTSYQHVSLQHLLSTSDVVSIHCPLNDETRNLIDMDMLKLMKKTAYLINMGRGGIINEHALANALEDELIAGAALDVLTQEPLSSDNTLLKITNQNRLFITPHIAWASMEARRTLIEGISGNIREFMTR